MSDTKRYVARYVVYSNEIGSVDYLIRNGIGDAVGIILDEELKPVDVNKIGYGAK